MANLRDFTGKNPVFTGTSGVRASIGDTSNRVNTTGIIRFNTSLNLLEYYNGTIWKLVDSPPTITGVDVSEVNLSDSTLNQTFVITGSGFASGAIVTFVGNLGTNITASTTTVNSTTQITAVAPRASFLNAQEPYGIKVENASGLSTTLTAQINVDSAPTWVTASGSLGTIYSNDTGNHFTVSATDPEGETVSYSETGGTVLSTQNLTLNSSTGVISGDPTDVGSDTTLSFTLRATANSKTTDRAFSILLKPPTNYFGDGSDGSLST
jgi:hypothetical protein